jgi:hypothetical protein
MRNIKTIISASSIFIIVCIANPIRAQVVQQEAEKSKPVPAAVTAILEKSCIGCHSDDGSTLAKMHFNFTKWNEYSADEQASTGQDICKILNKGKMPPKKFLKDNPESKLSDEEKSVICSWTTSLNAGK